MGFRVHMYFMDAHGILVFAGFTWMHMGFCVHIFFLNTYRALLFKCYSRMHIGLWCSSVIHGYI